MYNFLKFHFYERFLIVNKHVQISSGPTVTLQNGNLKETSLKILKKYGIKNEKVFKILSDNENDILTEKDDNSALSHVHNFLIGNNRIALESAEKSAQVIFQPYSHTLEQPSVAIVLDLFRSNFLSTEKCRIRRHFNLFVKKCPQSLV